MCGLSLGEWRITVRHFANQMVCPSCFSINTDIAVSIVINEQTPDDAIVCLGEESETYFLHRCAGRRFSDHVFTMPPKALSMHAAHAFRMKGSITSIN